MFYDMPSTPSAYSGGTKIVIRPSDLGVTRNFSVLCLIKKQKQMPVILVGTKTFLFNSLFPTKVHLYFAPKTPFAGYIVKIRKIG